MSSAPSAGAAAWAPVTLKNEADMLAFARELRATFPNLDMNYDVEWLCVQHGWPENEILFMAAHEGGAITGYAAFLVAKTTLTYALGPFVLWKQPVRQLKLYQGLVARDDRAADRCFEALRRTMGRGVVFAGAVQRGSLVRAQIEAVASGLVRGFHVLGWGNETWHCLVKWEGSLEKYLASLGKKSGKELQRNAKLLFSDAAIACELKVFRTPAEAEAFLSDGIALSDKTYQKRDLGLGIARGGAVERLIRFAAARGAFHGYILYINGAPAAFRYGFQCGDTCTMKQTGYDPAWADRQIGSVIFFETMRDFARIKLPATWLDFMPDVTLFKLRTTNDRRSIRHFYFFPRTIEGTLQFLALGALDRLSRTVAPFLAKRREGELEKYLARLAAEGKPAT